MKRILLTLCLVLSPVLAGAAEPSPADFVDLPKPNMDGGRPLMQVLHDRKSTREFNSEPICKEHLSNMLWAGFGINRPETGQRTAPCTMNLRSVEIYVATTEGAYRYDAEKHRLEVLCREDVRHLTGGQDYVKTAAVALIYVSDQAKFASKAQPAERDFYSAADTGFIGQNVYLYCASESLGCVVHMAGDRAALGEKLKLRPEQKIVLVESVGHPAKK